MVIKAVNPRDRSTGVEVELNGDFAPSTASMQTVAPGSLRARNTLEAPGAVRPEPGVVQLNGKRVRFDLPAHSTAVVRLD
jgi:alpha-L-arabinofuranosidase